MICVTERERRATLVLVQPTMKRTVLILNVNFELLNADKSMTYGHGVCIHCNSNILKTIPAFILFFEPFLCNRGNKGVMGSFSFRVNLRASSPIV